MKWLTVFILFLFFSSCKKDGSGLSDCMEERVDNFKSNTPCPDGASIGEYELQGARVYVFNPGNCIADVSSPVYDSDCNHIGNLGGLMPNFIINGVDFRTHAVFKRTVWQD
jgi:hypothetical protein